VKQSPIYDATVPIACTLSGAEIQVRVAEMGNLRSNLDRLERTPDGVLLHFPNQPAIVADVRRFAVDEKRCCSFWGFEIQTDDDHLVLRWDGPPDVRNFFDQLVAFFEGEESGIEIDGLL
jgi:hypothetical protein